MKRSLALFLLLLSAPSAAQTLKTPAAKMAPVRMVCYYFRDVAGNRPVSEPLEVVITHDQTGREQTILVNQRNGKSFRDGAHIQADMNALRKKPMTPQGRAEYGKLTQEMSAWRRLLRRSPVILTEADLEPECQASLDTTRSIPVVSEVFTPEGAGRIARFTREHTGAVLAVVVDDRLLSAPIIMAPILNGQAEISGGLQSLDEAQSLAARLNSAAASHRKP